MSTVAWDGRDAAADSRIWCDTFYKDDFEKMRVHHTGTGKVAIALLGNTSRALQIADWYLKGKDAADFPKRGKEEENGAIVVFAHDLAFAYEDSPFCSADEAPMAWGSGRVAAMAAMMCGRSASEAVAIAARLDSNTGGPVTTIKTKGVLG